MKVKICAGYYAGTCAEVDLPDDVQWDDATTWYVKWDTLHYQVKDMPDKWFEVPLCSDTMDIIDWKRPTDVTVYSCDEDGYEQEELYNSE